MILKIYNLNWAYFFGYLMLKLNCKLTFKSDGSFKLLHVSDVHYEIPSSELSGCQDIYPSQLPCNNKNSTSFLQWLIEVEKPDLIVHTGDIIDWATYPSTKGMDEYYGVSISNYLPWAASLGNHDDDSPTMQNRSDVINYIVNLPGTLTEIGPIPNSYGNFVLEIFPSPDSTIPTFRTYHFDSDTNEASITSEQVNWYINQSSTLNNQVNAPALAFYHIPLEEYYVAVSEGQPIIGGLNENICYQPENNGLFDAFLSQGDVKAGFCGHDHTNDFCVNYKGVDLCYEGSPSWQAYGTSTWPRRARVTELRDFGSTVMSWKRLDESTGEGQIVDFSTLWSQSASTSTEYSEKANVKKFVHATNRRTISAEVLNSLPRREQKHRRG